MPISFVLPDPIPLSRDPAERVRQLSRGTNNIVFSPSGRLLATSDVRMNVTVKREEDLVFAANYENLNEKIRATDRVRDLAFFGERDLWIAAGESVRLVDLELRNEVLHYVAPRDWGFLVISPTSIAIAPDGTVAVAFDNGGIAMWSRYGEPIRQWIDNDGPRTIGFLDDGATLFGTDSFSMCLWDVETQKKVSRWTLDSRAFGLAVEPSRKWVATRHLKNVIVWDLVSGKPIGTFPVSPGLPLVEFHPRYPRIAVGAQRGVEIVDLYTMKTIESFSLNDENLISMQFSPSGNMLLAGTSDEALRPFYPRLP